jgi:hypothetical protein
MEIEATTTEVTVAVTDVSPHTEGFGTRAQTGRPHSMSLFGADRIAQREGTIHGLDVLLGVGIGAVIMYYLDPDGGARRRGTVRDSIVHVVTTAPDTFEAAAHDLGEWARDTIADAKSRRALDGSADGWAGDWTPASRLAASTVGGVLTLFAAKRRDAFGAAVGLVGSALLARGATRGSRRDRLQRLQMTDEPVAREVGDALERPRLLEEM